MIKNRILDKLGYAKLVTDVRQLIEEGRVRTEAAVKNELVSTYWMVGKRIVEEGLTSRANYGESILEELSQDLNVHMVTLRQATLFFRQYEINTPRGLNLTWSHYRELMYVTDKKERQFYEKKASNGQWTRNQLVDSIKSGQYTQSQKIVGKKKTTIVKLKRPTAVSYVYKAIVQRVIDGDTLLVRVDLGFQVWKEQRIRLSGIDAPEKKTPEGRKAYITLRDLMAQLDFIVIKTRQIDIYGRYLGHIFYSFQDAHVDKIFSQGKYLNQELLDKGVVKGM